LFVGAGMTARYKNEVRSLATASLLCDQRSQYMACDLVYHMGDFLDVASCVPTKNLATFGRN